MSEPVIEHSEDETTSPGRVMAFIFPMILFLGGIALFATFDYDSTPWGFVGGIVLIALAFAIPTTILPALEDRE